MPMVFDFTIWMLLALGLFLNKVNKLRNISRFIALYFLCRVCVSTCAVPLE